MGCEIEAREKVDSIMDEIESGAVRDFTYLEMLDVIWVLNTNLEGINGR
jgi:hypothetical protein